MSNTLKKMKLKSLLSEQIINEVGGAGAIAARNAEKRRKRASEFNKKHSQGKSDWYKETITNPDTGKKILVKTALGYDKKSPVYLAAIKKSKDHGLDHIYNAHFTPKGTLRQKGSRTKPDSDKPDDTQKQKSNIFSKMKNFFGL